MTQELKFSVNYSSTGYAGDPAMKILSQKLANHEILVLKNLSSATVASYIASHARTTWYTSWLLLSVYTIETCAGNGMRYHPKKMSVNFLNVTLKRPRSSKHFQQTNHSEL